MKIQTCSEQSIRVNSIIQHTAHKALQYNSRASHVNVLENTYYPLPTLQNPYS